MSELVLGLTAQIVSAHVRKSSVAPSDLTTLIREVYSTLESVSTTNGSVAYLPAEEEVGAAAPQIPVVEAKAPPAVPISKSIFPDYIVCLEDGKKLTMLKRHLQTSYGLTPEAYREKWGLPPDYPMVAPKYAEMRSKLAKENGLGRKRSVVPPPPPPKVARGRSRKAA